MPHWKKLVTTHDLAGLFVNVEYRLGLNLARLHTNVNHCFRISAVVMMESAPI